MAERFQIGKGEMHGSTQVTFYYCDKVTVYELLQALQTHFPGVDYKDLNVFPGPVCTVTTGKSLEVPPT